MRSLEAGTAAVPATRAPSRKRAGGAQDRKTMPGTSPPSKRRVRVEESDTTAAAAAAAAGEWDDSTYY